MKKLSFLLSGLFVIAFALTLTSFMSSNQTAVATGDYITGEDGKAIYTEMCKECHGKYGDVDADFPALSDAEFISMTRDGVDGTDMPAYPKSEITDAEMKELLAYVRELTE